MAVRISKKEPKTDLSPPVDLELEEDSLEEMEGLSLADASKERKLPDFPAKRIEANKSYLFWEWAEQLVEEDFEHLVIYVYRHYPVIDRQINNPRAGKNIDKLSSKATCNLKHIIENHGSGLYKLLVNDINKAVNGKGGTLGACMLSIQESDKPPILVLDELVIDHPDNRSYVDKLKAEGKLTGDGRIMTPQQGGDNSQLVALMGRMLEKLTNPATQPRDTSASDVSKMYVDANKTMLDMVKEQVKTDGPDKLLTMLSALKEMIPKPENNNSMLEVLLRIQAEATARNDAMQAKLMEVLMKPPEDATAKMLTQIQMFKELGLIGGEAPREHKRTTAEVIIDAIAPIGLEVAGIIKNVITMKNYQAGIAKQAPQQQTEPQALPQGENVIEMPSPEANPFVPLLSQYGGMIINAMKKGVPGSAFAESVETLTDALTYKQLHGLGTEGLIAAMKSVPAFWADLMQSGATEQIVKEFCDDFVAYGNEEVEGEE